MEGLEIAVFKGKQTHQHIDKLAHLRINVFKEYPYLYDGSLDNERTYLKTYTECDESILIVIFDNKEIVGASTAIPLAFETPECQQPFIENNLPISDIFYFGESVLLPAYRHRGVYKHFFSQREKAAKDYGSKQAAFCAVLRDENDTRKPMDYVPLNDIWHHFGYQQHPKLLAYYEWLEVNQSQKTKKPMTFWMKTL
ncbi:MAG: hypothetical protein AB7V32_11425 [Candidatus Berkiella sp.]